MADYGYFLVTRKLRRDYEKHFLSLQYRHIFETILDYAAFEECEQDDHGVTVIVQPFQLLVSEDTLLEYCNKGLKNKDKISESTMHRALEKFRELGWLGKIDKKLFSAETERERSVQKSNQESNQRTKLRKTLHNILREDILFLKNHEANQEPNHLPNQERTKSEPQKKKDKKDKKDKNKNKSLLLSFLDFGLTPLQIEQVKANYTESQISDAFNYTIHYAQDNHAGYFLRALQNEWRLPREQANKIRQILVDLSKKHRTLKRIDIFKHWARFPNGDRINFDQVVDDFSEEFKKCLERNQMELN